MYVHRCLLVHITTTCDAVVHSGKMKCRVPRNSRCSLNVECAHIARSLAPLLHEQVARTQTPNQNIPSLSSALQLPDTASRQTIYSIVTYTIYIRTHAHIILDMLRELDPGSTTRFFVPQKSRTPRD